jgi:pimeloyl-ACP methyl ester carboxylesterase
MSLLIFSHANSFPAGTYGVLFGLLRERGFTVKAIDQYGHDPAYPVSNNWPLVVQQLADFAKRETDKAGEPAFLVGHSLGGYLSLMAAARHPELARAVLLLDSPILGGWRATTLGMVKRTDWVGNFTPGAISKKRRDAWPSQAAALAHFQSKKAFARWAPQVLEDYIANCTRDAPVPPSKAKGADPSAPQTRRVLNFNREVETAFYNTVPDNFERVLRRHPLKCPVAFVGGLHSTEMKQVGMALTDKITKGRIALIKGSHLFPMEKPIATAAAIEMYWRDMVDGLQPAQSTTPE